MSTYITATMARKNFFSLIDQASKPGKHISITHAGIPKVVMMSQEDFEGLIETLEIMSDQQLMKDIREGLKEKGGISLEDLEKELLTPSYVSRHSPAKSRKTVSKTAKRHTAKDHGRAAKAAR